VDKAGGRALTECWVRAATAVDLRRAVCGVALRALNAITMRLVGARDHATDDAPSILRGRGGDGRNVAFGSMTIGSIFGRSHQTNSFSAGLLVTGRGGVQPMLS
jgi:hypothetical protein